MASLQERADRHRSRFRVLESVPGSGFHKNDRDPVYPERMLAPDQNGFKKASEQPVAFFDEHCVTFVGDDASTILGALQDWYRTRKSLDEIATWDQRRMRYIPRLKIENDKLRLPLSEWNDHLDSIQEAGIAFHGLSLTDETTDPAYVSTSTFDSA